MKRLLLVTFTFCLLQVTSAQHPHWGLKGGINLANVGVDGGNNPNSKIGIHLGGLAHIHLSEHFALQPELMYSNQGYRWSDDNKTKLHYLNVPVLLQFMTGSGFRLQTGPQLGVLLTAKNKINDTETEVDDSYETADFSWSFGASYVAMTGLGFDVRYNHGITNINDGQGSELRNKVFQFGVFYQFRVSEYRRNRR